MDLSSDKTSVLEALLLHEKSVKAAQVAQEMGKEARVIQMHLIGLVRTGYAQSPEKGCYVISAKGKTALGLPELTKEHALSILSHSPAERAFHFYAGIGRPQQVYAHSLLEFCTKIDQVNTESVEFHLKRGDFEAWFKSLGDLELAKKISLLKERKLAGDELRRKIQEIVQSRCIVLSKTVT